MLSFCCWREATPSNSCISGFSSVRCVLWVQLCQSGFQRPILIKQVDGLGMKLPPPSFTVRDVARILGDEFPLDVIEVSAREPFAARAQTSECVVMLRR